MAVVEKGLEFKEYSLGVFLDIAGAFNNVSIEAIIESLLETGMNNAAFLWIGSLLRCRKIKAEWNDAMAIKRVVRRMPQAGVLSPLLWLLVMNRMLKMFDGKASKLIAIIVTGKCLSTLSSIMNSTLQDISEWARSTGLDINAEKTDMVLFTRRYKIPRWYPPKIYSMVLTLKSQ